MTTQNMVNVGLKSASGTGSFVGSNSAAITTGFFDSNANAMFFFNPVGSAVNYVTVNNNIATAGPGLTATGSDTNIDLFLGSKGTGGAYSKGSANASVPFAGYVGEVLTSNIANGSATSLSTTTAKDVTSISLTAGDWDVYGNIFWNLSVSASSLAGWISTTSATKPDLSTIMQLNLATILTSGFVVPGLRVNVSTTTTCYLSTVATFGSGTCTASGTIFARRRR